jgi:hypothetical protein
MAYVPGFEHDLFISYAHGDDRDWINRLIDRLRPALKRLLGSEAQIWIDDDNLRASQGDPPRQRYPRRRGSLPSPTCFAVILLGISGCAHLDHDPWSHG